MKPPEERMVARAIVVRERDIVFLKGIVEAHDGVAQVYGERGGSVVITAPESRERELDELVDDLVRELGAIRA